MKSLTTRLLVGMVAGLFVSTMASAETIRWARAGDSLTMDPHAQNASAHRVQLGRRQYCARSQLAHTSMSLCSRRSLGCGWD